MNRYKYISNYKLLRFLEALIYLAAFTGIKERK